MSAATDDVPYYDVIIVGAGPAGTSAALTLVSRDPRWADRLLILDKAHFPRPKLCGGGVTLYGEQELHRVGLDIANSVSSFAIERVHLRFQDVQMTWFERAGRVFRTVRREEFDHWLLETVRARGVLVREGAEVTSVRREPEGFVVGVGGQFYRCRVLVGAGGANGVVRRSLGWQSASHTSRMLEVLTPCHATAPEFSRHYAVFDFTPLTQRVQGYYWDFPSYVDGRATMNRGIFDSRARPDLPRAELKSAFGAALAQRGEQLSACSLQGHPARWFDPQQPLAADHVLLVGDEAGFDPLFGEGIAFALAGGRLAAWTIGDAFASGDFSFRDYRAHLLADPVWGGLARRITLAKLLYGLRDVRLLRLMWQVGSPLLWLALTGKARFGRTMSSGPSSTR